MPVDIVVADHTGTFNDYLSELEDFAAEYAGPINRRAEHLADPRKIRRRLPRSVRRTIFPHSGRLPQATRRRSTRFSNTARATRRAVSPIRWEKVLERLDATDPRELARQIREQVRNLPPGTV